MKIYNKSTLMINFKFDFFLKILFHQKILLKKSKKEKRKEKKCITIKIMNFN